MVDLFTGKVYEPDSKTITVNNKPYTQTLSNQFYFNVWAFILKIILDDNKVIIEAQFYALDIKLLKLLQLYRNEQVDT